MGEPVMFNGHNGFWWFRTLPFSCRGGPPLAVAEIVGVTGMGLG
jgi:hypothetical protein